MIAQDLLPMLDKVRQKSETSWMASCPLHEDKNPSFIISNGTSKEGLETVIMKCFSCHGGIDEICDSLGITVSDLYPKTDNFKAHSSGKVYFPAGEVLKALAEDITFVMLVSKDMHKGLRPDQETSNNLRAVHERMHTALGYIKK